MPKYYTEREQADRRFKDTRRIIVDGKRYRFSVQAQKLIEAVIKARVFALRTKIPATRLRVLSDVDNCLVDTAQRMVMVVNAFLVEVAFWRVDTRDAQWVSMNSRPWSRRHGVWSCQEVPYSPEEVWRRWLEPLTDLRARHGQLTLENWLNFWNANFFSTRLLVYDQVSPGMPQLMRQLRQEGLFLAMITGRSQGGVSATRPCLKNQTRQHLIRCGYPSRSPVFMKPAGANLTERAFKKAFFEAHGPNSLCFPLAYIDDKPEMLAVYLETMRSHGCDFVVPILASSSYTSDARLPPEVIVIDRLIEEEVSDGIWNEVRLMKFYPLSASDEDE